MTKNNGQWMDQVEIDLKKLKVRKMQEYTAKLRAEDGTVFAQHLSLVVSECPEEWGPPDKAETYEKLSFQDIVLPIYGKYLEMKTEVSQELIEGVEIDLSVFNAREFSDMQKAITAADIDSMIPILMRCVTKLPAGMGKPDKEATYLNMEHFTQFLRIANMVAREGNDLMQNFLKRYTGR